MEDKLNRAAEAERLIAILISEQSRRERHSGAEGSVADSSLVVSVTAPWGYGKTTFVKLMKQKLQAESGNKHFVFYFDAWKNDYSEDALTSFLAEFKASLDDFVNTDLSDEGKAIQGTFDVVRAKAEVFLSEALPLLAGRAGKKLFGIGVEEVADIAEAMADAYTSDKLESEEQGGGEGTPTNENSSGEDFVAGASGKAIEKMARSAIAAHNKTKGARVALSSALRNLQKAIADHDGYTGPIFIFVDELDRCRPSYAIELLEAMKHFFSATGVVYVVSNNSTELGHSIKAIYGESFNSTEYLKRFFDFEYRLTKPDMGRFIGSLVESYGFDETERFVTPFHSDAMKRMGDDSSNELKNECGALVSLLFVKITQQFGLSLRDSEQVALRMNAISAVHGKQLDFFLLCCLVSADHKESGLHTHLLDSKSSRFGHLFNQYGIEVKFPVLEFGLRNTREAIRTDNPTTQDMLTSYSLIAGYKIGEIERSIKQQDVKHCPSVIRVLTDMGRSKRTVREEYFSLVEQMSTLAY